jgi:membrane-associated phospholipid phosphatase
MSTRTLHSLALVPFFNIVDPLVVQGMAAAHALLSITLWCFYDRPGEIPLPDPGPPKLKDLVTPALRAIVALSVLVVAFYLLNDFVYKIAFNRLRPSHDLRLPLGFLSRSLKVSEGGAPSGFASRAAILFLAGVLPTFDLRQYTNRSLAVLTSSKGAALIQGVLLVLTCASRVYSGYHFVFDILMGLSLATLTFWLVTLPFAFHGRTSRQLALHYAPAILISSFLFFSILGLFYSRDATGWVPVLFIATIPAIVPEAIARVVHDRTQRPVAPIS